MAITFDSVKDPYGLGQASNAIGGAYMQKALLDSQQQRQRTDEERIRNRQIQDSQTLGTTLRDLQPAEGQQWDQDRIASFMTQALENGMPISDILSSIKGLEAARPKAQSIQQTTFSKQIGKQNADLLSEYSAQGKVAKNMLSNWDELDKSINDPERFENPAMRSLKMIPGASVNYSPSDQTIATYGKEIITNFTNMKNLRLTDAKLRWLESIAPAPWKSKEANLQASAHFKRMAQIQEAYGDVASNIANAYVNAGLDVPANYDKLVEDAVEPLRQEIDNLYKESTKNSENQPKITEVGSKFDKMPNAKNYEGAEITDSKGNKFVSDGTKWSKVK